MVIWRHTYGKGPIRKREWKPAAATCAILSDLQQRFFYMHHPTDRITHTMAFVTPVVEHWLEREIAQWVHHEGSIRQADAHVEMLVFKKNIILTFNKLIVCVGFLKGF